MSLIVKIKFILAFLSVENYEEFAYSTNCLQCHNGNKYTLKIDQFATKYSNTAERLEDVNDDTEFKRVTVLVSNEVCVNIL